MPAPRLAGLALLLLVWAPPELEAAPPSMTLEGMVGATSQAADTLLPALLKTHSHPLELRDGRLQGPGGTLLLEEGERAHFVLIGEDHGVAEVPQLTAALFRELRPHGYRHLVIETSPPLARLLDRVARKGQAEILALTRAYPVAVPFYGWHEEADLLAAVVEGAGPEPVVWGVDYEFMATPAMWLEKLADRAPDAAARRLADSLRAGEVDALQQLFERGDPSGLLLSGGKEAELASLATAFRNDEEARAILEWIALSTEPWRLWFEGQPWDSNRARTDLLRRAFIDQYRGAPQEAGAGPRAILKFGAFHMYRGRTPVNVFDLGTLAPMLAEYEGSTAFNFMALAGRGTRRTAMGPGGSMHEDVEPRPWAEPLYEAADSQRWTLFDLRPLRPHLAAGRLDLHPELARAVWGFDAVIILVGSRPAGFE
jgi:hypothetical protein